VVKSLDSVFLTALQALRRCCPISKNSASRLRRERLQYSGRYDVAVFLQRRGVHDSGVHRIVFLLQNARGGK